MISPMTQTEQVLAWLRAHDDGLTPGQALDIFGCFRLAARIAEAKERLEPDEEIINVGLTTPTGKHVARYRLVHREPAQPSGMGGGGMSGDDGFATATGPCSCGRGEVGHTDTHQSTDRKGYVRLTRPGKTDQYMNIAQVVNAQATADRANASRVERAALLATPRIDPRGHRLVFGGPTICTRCGGTGGNLIDICYSCGGKGLR